MTLIVLKSYLNFYKVLEIIFTQFGVLNKLHNKTKKGKEEE